MLCTIGGSIPASRLAAQDVPVNGWPNDRVFIRDFLAHAKLATTDRYLSAKLRLGGV